ncbi:hypothetical protein AKA01nite_01050 [Alkalibacterium kapii]|uniref:Uncharacterized protein n=1 Tax=Alkalibacterium kapii TaxID=426704 RepID=A0A511AT47_9LACT|nr:hypothetical protein AKA01nite_01050 [Alkalibacterium kapii]
MIPIYMYCEAFYLTFNNGMIGQYEKFKKYRNRKETIEEIYIHGSFIKKNI